MKLPEITVFMAAYNQASYIEQSINSILNQSFPDFELIVVNDGSTDSTAAMVSSIQDDRIKLVNNEHNQGLIFTRNRLLTLARGKYIAILDADDIAHPERLQLQYNFLVQNPSVVLCGGHANIINERGMQTGEKLRVPTDETVDMFMLFGNPFVNSTTMFKTAVFKEIGGYKAYKISEDYDLFIRMSRNNRIANLDHTLIDYRIHPKNTSAIHLQVRLNSEEKIISDLRHQVGVSTNDEMLQMHLEIFNWTLNKKHLTDYASVLSELKNANRISGRYESRLFERFLFDKWCAILISNQINSLYLKWYLQKGLFSFSYLNFKKLRKSFKNSLKSLFK